MRLTRTERLSDTVLGTLSEALGFDPDGPTEDMLASARELAFLSDSSDEFAEWYLRAECLRKFQGAECPEAATLALQKFWEGDVQCRETNVVLANYADQGGVLTDVLCRAARLVKRVLGDSLTVDEIMKRAAHGPGAMAGVSRKRATRSYKMDPGRDTDQARGVTEKALSYAIAFSRGCHLAGRTFKVVPGDAIKTVTKDWEVRRTINCQPEMNLFFQLGLGACIRARLMKVGLLRPDAQQVQRELAREGSITGKLATLDVRNGSGTQCIELLRLLVEQPFVGHIMALRSERAWLNPQEEKSSKWEMAEPYGMIASMGCGFTFELETLLFWALTAAACSKLGHHWSTVKVFGDDIICPSDAQEIVTTCLQMCGITLNDRKTFWEGPFRESCGGHYWKGDDVTPFYQKKYADHVSELVLLHNKCMVWRNARTVGGEICLREVENLCRRSTPKELYGPKGLPGCLWSTWDQACPTWVPDEQRYAQCVLTQVDATPRPKGKGRKKCNVLVEAEQDDTAKSWSDVGTYAANLWDLGKRDVLSHVSVPRYNSKGVRAVMDELPELKAYAESFRKPPEYSLGQPTATKWTTTRVAVYSPMYSL